MKGKLGEFSKKIWQNKSKIKGRKRESMEYELSKDGRKVFGGINTQISSTAAPHMAHQLNAKTTLWVSHPMAQI